MRSMYSLFEKKIVVLQIQQRKYSNKNFITAWLKFIELSDFEFYEILSFLKKLFGRFKESFKLHEIKNIITQQVSLIKGWLFCFCTYQNMKIYFSLSINYNTNNKPRKTLKSFTFSKFNV